MQVKDLIVTGDAKILGNLYTKDGNVGAGGGAGGGEGGSSITYRLTKSGQTITLTGSDGSTSSVVDSDTTTSVDLSGYLSKSGGTMTGALNFKNGTWNTLGDDVYFGDNDTAGSFAIKGVNGTTNLKMVANNSSAYGTLSWNGSQFVSSNNFTAPAFIENGTALSSKYAPISHTHDDRYFTESEINSKLSGYVPTSRTVNGKALTGNIRLSASDIGAAATSHASSTTSYGVGNSNNYGHVKLYQTSNCSNYTSEDGACTPAAVKKAVQLFGQTKMSNGPVIISETQTLDMSQYGLSVGDQVNVVCIGGGGGGGGKFGGAAGHGGDTYSYDYAGGGGGGGGGFGAGGGGGGYHGETIVYAGGGGGSGYLSAKTITLTSLSVAVTIGAGGAANENGGTTSFGTYLSAAGGTAGGKGGSSAANSGYGGAGGHKGGNSTSGDNTGGGGAGGGGGGGWLVTSVAEFSGSNGENAKNSARDGDHGGAGGTGGGAGGPGLKAGGDGSGTGSGVVIFWY